MNPSITISVIALIMGILLSGVAAFFSVLGLATIFSGAFIAVAIMGGALEASKLVAASWIYRHWNIAPLFMKFYMTTAVVVLILITSLGIFGYLSRAHIDSQMTTDNIELQLEIIDSRIERQINDIESNERLLEQMDNAIETLIEFDRISGDDGAIARRESQMPERERLSTIINDASDRLQSYREERASIESQRLESEAKIGPLKYIAELIYGEENASQYFDSAVRYIIIIIVLVFDPLAVCLLLAANTGFMHRKTVKEKDWNKFLNENSVDDMEHRSIDGQE